MITSHMKVTGKEAEAFRDKRKAFYASMENDPSSLEVALELMAGKGVYQNLHHPDLAIVQDIAVQAGQGRTVDRALERLGRSDNGIIAWRKILTRELKAIAGGGQPKAWTTPPPEVEPTLGF